jgi:hypothetical protein
MKCFFETGMKPVSKKDQRKHYEKVEQDVFEITKINAPQQRTSMAYC